MVWYQLSNLLLYKHELLLSKCPLTADWLLIRPVWNEISNEPVKYDPIPERIISNTHTHDHSLLHVPPLCLFLSSFLLPSVCFSPCDSSSSVLHVSPHLTFWSFSPFLLSLPVSQNATAAADRTSACLTRSSTAAQAVGGGARTAGTTLTDPTVNAAWRITTGNPPPTSAFPATATSKVGAAKTAPTVTTVSYTVG